LFNTSNLIAGLQNPYMVLMDFDVATVQSHASLLGFDAISTYALPGGTLDVNRSFVYYCLYYLSIGNSIC
jgi:hypothetical protein